MRLAYKLIVRLFAPLAFAVVLARGFRDRAYWQALSERFGYGARLAPGPRIWLHAVSMGEVAAAAPVVRGLQARYPGVAIVITTATPTGRSRALALFASPRAAGNTAETPAIPSVAVRYLPYDLPGAVARFLERTQPQLAVIMETELWPNLYGACAARGLPLVLANARLSAKSVSRYRRFGDLFRGLFTPKVWIAAQTTADAERFQLGRAFEDPAGNADLMQAERQRQSTDAAARDENRHVTLLLPGRHDTTGSKGATAKGQASGLASKQKMRARF